MKMIKQDLVIDGAGVLGLVAQEPDDLWRLYKNISQGDSISADTTRKVSAGGKKSTGRVKLRLEIKVEKIEYDKQGELLRVLGKTISDDNGPFRGMFHTLEINTQLPLELKKKVWKKSTLDELFQESIDGTKEMAVVLLSQQGLADVFLVGKYGSLKHCEKIEQAPAGSLKDSSNPKNKGLRGNQEQTPVPQRKLKERAPTKDSATATTANFFEAVLKSLVEFVDFNTTKCIVIAGAGNLKDQFHRSMLAEAQRLKLKSILDNEKRFFLIGTNSNNLKEVLENPRVKQMVADIGELDDCNIFNEFTGFVLKDIGRTCYGLKSVEMADECAAVQTLLINDDLFRSPDIQIRKKCDNLIQSVKKKGGVARVFSCSNQFGVQLGQMTGVAAILRFPVPGIDDLDE